MRRYENLFEGKFATLNFKAEACLSLSAKPDHNREGPRARARARPPSTATIKYGTTLCASPPPSVMSRNGHRPHMDLLAKIVTGNGLLRRKDEKNFSLLSLYHNKISPISILLEAQGSNTDSV